MNVRVSTVDTAIALFRWMKGLDLRLILYAVVGAIVLQQMQISQAQGEIVKVKNELTGVKELVEGQTLLACLSHDSTVIMDLRKIRAPCARLFAKYGIEH